MKKIGIEAAGQRIIGRHISDFESDAIRVIGDNTVIKNCTITDTASFVPNHIRDNPNTISTLFFGDQMALAKEAHRDGVQLIPKHQDGNCHNLQYAGALLSNVLIDNNSFEAPWSKLQPIFMGDGLGENIIIQNNRVNSGSEHQISLYGLIDGCIKDNTQDGNRPANVRLRPCRWGGGLPDMQRIWIRSFSDEKYDYSPSNAVYHDDKDYLLDQRRSTDLPGDNIYLENFDVEEAQAAIADHMRIFHINGAENACRFFHKIALEYGVPYRKLF